MIQRRAGAYQIYVLRTFWCVQLIFALSIKPFIYHTQHRYRYKLTCTKWNIPFPTQIRYKLVQKQLKTHSWTTPNEGSWRATACENIVVNRFEVRVFIQPSRSQTRLLDLSVRLRHFPVVIQKQTKNLVIAKYGLRYRAIDQLERPKEKPKFTTIQMLVIFWLQRPVWPLPNIISFIHLPTIQIKSKKLFAILAFYSVQCINNVWPL